MSGESWNELNNRACKHLRSKEMFYESKTAKADKYDSGIFWCHCTEKCLGPDGEAAGDDECGSDRSCFEQ